MKILYDSLMINNSIRKLSLMGNSFGKGSKNNMKWLCRIISDTKQIKYLDLTVNQFDENKQYLKDLRESFDGNSSIKTLELDNEFFKNE